MADPIKWLGVWRVARREGLPGGFLVRLRRPLAARPILSPPALRAAARVASRTLVGDRPARLHRDTR
ncbi:putative nitrite and sulphite reductase [Streptomyces sp. NBRC 110611]|nr:putative nitrite and sulphite reductase [Streptomyces sp. NBRC 110611]